jgi:mannose-6-phosphate isomerase class I
VGKDGCVYLGLKEGVDRERMIADLRAAQEDDTQFDTDKYVNKWPAKKHDHFLIPAGTPHCSGKNLVLEISATPYIFTFKMWDWGRLGLDGRPRPIHRIVSHSAAWALKGQEVRNDQGVCPYPVLDHLFALADVQDLHSAICRMSIRTLWFSAEACWRALT